ncbi:MAG: IPT/TIG domain-containing protein [Gemmatimonadetes bacterium]|nr:IPT/TIG domain-containing protein [Gemmatimonadota bacterium]
MKPSSAPRLRAARLLALSCAPLFAAACHDGPTRAAGETEPVVVLARLECQASVASGSVECAPVAAGASGGGVRFDERTVGGQGVYVRMASSGAAFDAVTKVFSFNATVQNLSNLAMATTTGAARHAGGVRVFLVSDPVGTGGAVTVANATGTAAFTGSNQSYFQYGGTIGGTDQGELGADGILASGEASTAKLWQFDMGTATAFTFSVYVATEMPAGALQTVAPQVTSVSPATLVPGASATLTGINFNATAASNTVMIGGRAATVTGGSATELQVVVPCVSSGTVPVQVAQGGMTGGALGHPLQVATRTLAVGQAAILSASAEAACNEIAASGGASRYVVAVYNTSSSPGSTSAFQISADGAAAGAPRLAASRAAVPGTGALGAVAEAQRPEDAHLRMLEFNRRSNEELRARFAGDRRMRPRTNVSANPVEPPVTRTIRVFDLNGSSCDRYTSVNATRVYYNGKVAIYEDDNTPADLKASANDAMRGYYNAIGDQFNADMEPVVRNNFGDPLLRDATTDNNGVVVALFTPLLSNTGLAGFVVSCDQYPNAPGNLASNFGEYFYAYQPTVNGTGYASFTPDSWYRSIRATFIHETKHVASHAARVQNNRPFEQSWLEEGTARHSEELWARSAVYNVGWKANTGYGSAAAPGSVYCDLRPSDPACTATDPSRPSLNMYRHFSSLYTFMQKPHEYSPFGRTAAGGSSFYATSWSLVRYAIDRYGASDASFLTAINSSSTTGTANLAAAAGVSLEQLMGGWALSLYADDYPGLVGASADIQMPTWNFNNIYAGLNTDYPSTFAYYPLVPQAVSFGSVAATSVPSIVGGGVKYFEFTGTHTKAQLLRLEASGGGTPPSTLRVAIARLQ